MATRTIIDGGKQAITFNNDTEPVAVYVDGELQQNVSFVPQLAQGTGSAQYTSEYKKNHIDIEMQGTTSQKQYQGYNPFKFKDFTTSKTDSDGNVITLEMKDGIATIDGISNVFTTLNIPYTRLAVPSPTFKAGTYTFTPYYYREQGQKTMGADWNLGGYAYSGYTGLATKTFENDFVYNACHLYINPNTEFKDYKFAPAIFEGTYTSLDELPPYESYVGGIPSPNPQYPQEIENANKEGMSVTLHGDNFREEIAIPTSVEVDNGDGTTKTVDLPFTIYDKLIVDRVANTVKYKKKSGVRVFTGTEGFTASTSNDNDLYNYRIELYKIGFNETTSNGYCSHFTPVPRADYSKKYDVCFNVTDAFGDASIYFLYDKLDNDLFTARDMFKSWVAEQYNAGTPLTIVVEYEEVEPIDITQSSLAQSLLNLATQNQTNYFEITSNEEAPQVPIKINYAKWGELVENNNNT